MKNLVTEKEKITGVIKVWAIPRTDWYREMHPDEPPFQFELRTNTVFDDAAVIVYEEELTVTVPAGIDLREKAIETLEEAMEEVRTDSKYRLEELQTKVNNLRLLEHKPVLKEILHD